MGFFLLVTFIVFSNFMGAQIDLKPGQISPRNIRSPHAAIITDEARTRELQEQAAQKVRKVYQEDREALVEAEQDVNNFFVQVNNVRYDESLTRNDKIEQLRVFISEIVDTHGLEGYSPKDLAAYLVDADDEDIGSIRDGTLLTINNLMSQPITEEALPTAAGQVKTRAEALSYLPSARNVVEIATIRALRPNLIYNA
ncbi:MAG: phosphohydrolase, partial [Bacillota bacterium]